MRPRPDPLQRLALLQHDRPTAAVDLPSSAPDDDDQMQADPPVRIAAGADRMPDADDFRLDAESVNRDRIAEGSPPTPASGSTEPGRERVMGPPDPTLPVDRPVVTHQGFPPVSRSPGRHRHRRDLVATRSEIGEMPSPEDDVEGVDALSVVGGWVPNDGGEWVGFDSLEPHVRPPVEPEGPTLPGYLAATGADDDVDEHKRADGNGLVDLDRTDDAEQDDADCDGGVRSDFDGDDGDRDDGGGEDFDGEDFDGDDFDGNDSDGEDGNGDDGDGDDDSDDPDPPEVRAKRLRNRPWGRLAELWVPESLRDARIDPGRRGLLVLLLIAAVAAVATAIGVWRDRPEPRPVETVALAPASGVTGVAAIEPAPNSSGPPVSVGVVTAGAVSAPASTAPPTEIVVSVTGLVAHPGVVTLPVGARVTDAIAASGGSTAEADLTGLNLAAKLADGDSVVIAAAATGGANSGVSSAGSANSASPGKPGSQGQRTSSQLIDLNTADEAALDSLPGVGPVMAQNILAWRQQNGRFSSVEQLQEISGIGPARYAQISALVTVS